MASTGSHRDLRRVCDGLTSGEVIVVVVIVGIVGWIAFNVHFASRHNGRLSPRIVCAANLKGIGNGMASYATANNDAWPIPPHLAPVAEEVGRVRYAPGMIGKHRGPTTRPEDETTTEQDTEMSPTRCFWTLVRSGWSSPKSFLCPASEDQFNDEDDPQNFSDFRKYSEVSYGYQVPFGKYGRPSPNVDQDMALVADKGPYSAALEAGRKHPGIPNLTSSNSPQEWEPFNSPNHGGEGQWVLYADAHADFFMHPLAGVKKDNIYTRWSRADGGTDQDEAPRAQGTPPTGIETPWSDTDSLIYP